MTTSLCNVGVKCLRPRGYANLETWLQDPNHVYIARDGIINGYTFPRLNSPWANPFNVKKDGSNTLQSVIEQYFHYIVPKIQSGELYYELWKLKGKELGCWCMDRGVHVNFQPPFKCHGQVLMWLINYYFSNTIINQMQCSNCN